MSKRSLLALVALAVTGLPLAAQRVQVYEAPRGAGYESALDGLNSLTASRRAVIGVTIDMRPSANDSIGATVSAVTPGGPAARAGLVAGDIITKFDGTALVERGRRTDPGDEDAQSGPGLRMLELAARMSPGDTVTVEWKHERQRKTARIVAEASSAMVFSGQPGMRMYADEGPEGAFRYRVELGDNGPGMLRRQLEELRPMMLPGMDGGHLFMRLGGPFGGIQFAPLNTDLGRYFGTTEGILVLETPDTSTHVDLRGGDVILAIGDRKPTNVEHLFRILGSYQDDETVRFDVMRDKRRITVEAKADDLRASGRMRVFERSIPAEPAPMPGRAPQPSRRRSGT